MSEAGRWRGVCASTIRDSYPASLYRIVRLILYYSDFMENDTYALFAGHNYYPCGGAEDFRAFGSLDELKALFAEKADEWSLGAGGYPDAWGHIADARTMKVVLVYGRNGWRSSA